MYRKLKKRILWLVAAVMLAGLCFPGMEVMNVRAEESRDISQDEYGKGIKVKDMWLEGNTELSNLKAGDAFEITLLLCNDSDREATVQPRYCDLTWGKPGAPASDSPELLNCFGTDSAFLLSPGEERELTLEMQIGQYQPVGEWQLQYIRLNDAGGALTSTMYHYDPDWYDTVMTGIIGTEEAEPLPYTGEFDFSITSSETPDTDPPILESVSVTPAEVKAPGDIQLKFKTQGEIAPLETVSFSFASVEDVEPRFFGSFSSDQTDKFYYSDIEECYIVEYTLPETTLEGVYELSHIGLDDAADNRINYENRDGKLCEQNGLYEGIPEVDTCSLTVTDTEVTDTDIDAPKLAGIEILNNELSASDTLKVRIQAEEETGISDVTLSYACDSDQDGRYDTYVNMVSKNIIMEDTGYICEFDMDPYCISGTYDFQSILLTDVSIRKNGMYCYYTKETNLITGGSEVQFSPQSPLTLSISQADNMEIMDIRTDNITERAEAVEDGSTVVIKGSVMDELEIRLLPAEFWDTVKEKGLEVIIPDENSNSEIVVQGSELTSASAHDLELKIQREELVEQDAGIGQDDIYYPVSVVTTDATFPLTIKIRVGQEFLDQCGDNPIRISRLGADGDVAIMQDNLTVTEDGYLEIRFPNGLQGTGAATRILDAGTVGRSITSQEFSFIVSSSTSSVTKGDINGDGQINLVDLMQCLNHVGRKEELTGGALLAADIDESGDVNLVDLMRLLNYVGRKTPSL